MIKTPTNLSAVLQMSQYNRIASALRAEPEMRFAKTYHDAEHGATWRVITEWWLPGTPEAEGGDPSPLNGLIVTQRCVRSESDLWDAETFHPVSSGLSAD